jgi:hypothetical protein
MEGLKHHQPDVVVSDIANKIFEEEKKMTSNLKF